MKKVLLLPVLLIGNCVAQNGILLTWVTDGNPAVTRQLICRSTSSGTENCGAPYAVLGPNVTSYNDIVGVSGQTYYYVARACILALCSVNSNEASTSATFPQQPNPPTSLVAAPK